MEDIEKPWGKYISIYSSKYKDVNLLFINPKQRTSFHFHNKKKECYQIIHGHAVFDINKTSDMFYEGDVIDIDKNMPHRIFNPDEKEELIILEIETGIIYDADSYILHDDYGRK